MSKKLKKQHYKFYLIISIFSPIFNLLPLFLLSILSFFTLTLYFFEIASRVSPCFTLCTILFVLSFFVFELLFLLSFLFFSKASLSSRDTKLLIFATLL